MAQTRPATATDVDEIVDTLCSAFADDPLMRWMAHDPPDLPRRLRPFYRSVVRAHLRSPHPLEVTDDVAGVAMWVPPDRWKGTFPEFLRIAPGVLRSFRRPLRSLRVVNTMERHHPRTPLHEYLEIIGVRADAQGRGLGSALLASRHAELDRQGLPSFLESSNPRNVPFYARHGYVAGERLRFGPDEPHLTPMWREPRTD